MGIELNGLVCLITGADEGLGRGLALGFHKRGAQVVAGLLNPQTAAPFPDGVLCVPMDVTKAEQVQSAVESTLREFGRVDVLINNAGIYPRQATTEMKYDDWRRLMEINLDGAWRCCEAVIPHFVAQNSGVILNIGSITVRGGPPNMVHYQASKAGIIGLTRGLARDLGKYNVRVNCLHLGAVQTEGEQRVTSDPNAVLELANARQCLSGRQTPATVEPVFAFLASPESGDITGQCITVDRGWTHE